MRFARANNYALTNIYYYTFLAYKVRNKLRIYCESNASPSGLADPLRARFSYRCLFADLLHADRQRVRGSIWRIYCGSTADLLRIYRPRVQRILRIYCRPVPLYYMMVFVCGSTAGLWIFCGSIGQLHFDPSFIRLKISLILQASS